MRPVDILAKFLSMFPYYQETTRSFISDGPNSIIVAMSNGEYVCFTYFNKYNWRIVDKWTN